MDLSAFPGFESFEGFGDIFDDEGLGIFDSPNSQPDPQQTQTPIQAQQHQQQHLQPLVTQPDHMPSLDQLLQPLPQSFTDMQNHLTDPFQCQIQPEIPSQAPFHNIDLHHGQPISQSDLQSLIAQVNARIDVLQSQVDAEELQKQLQHRGQQPYLQVHTELQPEQSKVRSQRRRLEELPNDQNPPKRRRVSKESTGNSDALLTLGSASHAENSYVLGIASSDPQIKCPSCDIRFAHSHAVRQHFRMTHAITDMTSYICEECLMPCSNATRLHEHWKSAHLGELKFTCDLCGARFSKNRNLSMHRTKVHKLPGRPKPKTKRPRPKFPKCKFCGFTSPEKHNIAIHFFAEHCDEVGLECPLGCGKTFESKVDAGVHYFNCTHKSLADE